MVVQSLGCLFSLILLNKVSKLKLLVLGLVRLVMAVAIYIGFANKFGFDLNKMHYLFLVDQSYVINYLGWRVARFAFNYLLVVV